MARSRFLEGIQAGLQSFLQTKQVLEQLEASKEARARGALQQRIGEKQLANYETPQQERTGQIQTQQAITDYAANARKTAGTEERTRSDQERQARIAYGQSVTPPSGYDKVIDYDGTVHLVKKENATGGGASGRGGMGGKLGEILNQVPQEKWGDFIKEYYPGYELKRDKNGNPILSEVSYKPMKADDAATLLDTYFKAYGVPDNLLKEYDETGESSKMSLALQSGNPDDRKKVEAKIQTDITLLPYEKKLNKILDTDTSKALHIMVMRWISSDMQQPVFANKTAPKDGAELGNQIDEFMNEIVRSTLSQNIEKQNGGSVVRKAIKKGFIKMTDPFIGGGNSLVGQAITTTPNEYLMRSRKASELVRKGIIYGGETAIRELRPPLDFGPKVEKPLSQLVPGDSLGRFKITRIENRNGQTIWHAIDTLGTKFEFNQETMKLQLGYK